MSIPRFAIQRPVMMAMICAVVILLGGISLTRLPVDLLPDVSQPTISVRVNYTGVGPLEIESLITRPLEQQLSAGADARKQLERLTRAQAHLVEETDAERTRYTDKVAELRQSGCCGVGVGVAHVVALVLVLVLVLGVGVPIPFRV